MEKVKKRKVGVHIARAGLVFCILTNIWLFESRFRFSSAIQSTLVNRIKLKSVITGRTKLLK